MKKENTKKKKPISEKKRNVIIGCISAFLIVALTLSVVLPIALKKPKDVPFKIPELNLPIEEKYALQKLSYSDLSNTLTTLRADTMNVTKRGLQRAETTLLRDEFSIIYDSSAKKVSTAYGDLVATSGDKKTATIRFSKYPSPSSATNGSGSFTDGTVNGNAITDPQFYKYMLMSQGQHLAKEFQNLSLKTVTGEVTKEQYQSLLKKHPAADAQYGEVMGTNNAVEKEIIMDPIYRSPHVTGLYLPAGEVVTVRVEGLKEGERIGITIGLQNSLAWRGGADSATFNTIVTGNPNTNGLGQVSAQTVDAYFTRADVLVANGYFDQVTNQSQWGQKQNGRLPWLTADFTFSQNGTYYIGTPFGGIMHITPGNCYSSVKTTITGAVETPHYILGVTTPEYFDTYLRDAPGVIAVLDTENGQLIGPTGVTGTSLYMRQVKTDEIDKLAMLWHSFFSVNESFTGGTYNRFNKVMFDWHVPAGAAVALGNYSFACPTGWFNGAMNYRGLLSYGTWGILHEVGHNHGSSYGTVWGFGAGREGEVRNNALTLLAYIMFCDVGTTIRMGGSAEHGGYANPYSTLGETLKFPSQNHTDFDDGTYGYFQCLGMYSNIMHSFSAEKFYELLYTYKANPSYVLVDTAKFSDTERVILKRAEFAYRCSTVYGMNFIKYFNTFYKANITDNMFTSEQLSYMKSLPNYEPVSNFYAGGIDGVKTAGDYLVSYGNDLEFDLLNTTISSLDTADKKGFEILSGIKATYGKVKELGDGKISYSFSPKYFGTFDEITFKVKLSDGIIHEFTIYLRINYNGSKLTSYENLNKASGNVWDVVEEQLPNLTPKISSYPYSYTSSNSGTTWEARIVEYYWKAPFTGNLNFYVKRDDYLKLYFGESFNNIELQNTYNGDNKNWDVVPNKTYYVEAGKYYAIRLFNINTGGGGYAILGYKYEQQTSITQVPITEVFNPDYPLGEYHEDYNPKKTNIETYIFEPMFIVSKKDGIKVSTAGTNKTEWKILEAPADNLINGGRIETITRWETVRDEEGNPTGELTSYEIEMDRWNYLIDDDVSTMLHTVYGTGRPADYPTESSPFVFVLDTGKEQQFNYFAVSTRTGAVAVSKITKYELQISSDNINYTTISSGDELEYTKNVATLNFDSVSGRYFKLLVKGSTGNSGQFVIIAELDAGISSKVHKLVPASSGMLYVSKHWKNSSSIDSMQSGFMFTDRKNQKLVIRFSGENLSLYAAVGEGYGKAKVKVDGKYYSTLDFRSSIPNSRQLMLNIEKLENKTHTVEIITTSKERVMINMFGIDYNAEIINAPNIYLEKGLTISLIVFVLLFAAFLAFTLCLLFIPKFRKLMGDNRFIAALDAHMERRSEKIKAKKEQKRKEKALQQQIDAELNKDSAKATKKPAKSKTETKSADEKKKTVKIEKPVENKAVKSAEVSKAKQTVLEKKNDTKKTEVKKPEAKKAETKSAESKKIKSKKVENKKVEVKKPAPAKQTSTKTAPNKSVASSKTTTTKSVPAKSTASTKATATKSAKPKTQSKK